MRHITSSRVAIAALLLVCGGLAAVIVRQKARFERRAAETRQQYLTSDAGVIYSNLFDALDALPRDRAALLEYTSMPRLSDQLERAASDLEKAEIGMHGYYPALANSEGLYIELFMGFSPYYRQLYSIAGELKAQAAITPAQEQAVLAIRHDISLIHSTFVMAEGSGQSNQEITARMQAITPTLKLNSVRHELDLFPSIFPQSDTTLSDTGPTMILSAPTTCAEVGQPVTLTLELVNRRPGPAPMAIESVDIVISGNGREERWEAVGQADGLALGYREIRAYEWVWDASEAFSNTTVLVEARTALPESGPPPTPDPNEPADGAPAGANLKLGVGALTQTWEARTIPLHGIIYQAPPRTLPCAEMVR